MSNDRGAFDDVADALKAAFEAEHPNEPRAFWIAKAIIATNRLAAIYAVAAMKEIETLQ